MRTPAQTRAANRRHRELIVVAFTQPVQNTTGYYRAASGRKYGYLDSAGAEEARQLMADDDYLTNLAKEIL